MLGNARHAHRPGEPWMDRDAMVYVCRDIDVAKQILNMSQHGFVDDMNPLWTTIYHVTAPMIECQRADCKMLWTTDATKIIVDRPVFRQEPSLLSEQMLLDKARAIRSEYFKTIKPPRRKVK